MRFKSCTVSLNIVIAEIQIFHEIFKKFGSCNASFIPAEVMTDLFEFKYDGGNYKN